jgi:hypothetical protein
MSRRRISSQKGRRALQHRKAMPVILTTEAEIDRWMGKRAGAQLRFASVDNYTAPPQRSGRASERP